MRLNFKNFKKVLDFFSAPIQHYLVFFDSTQLGRKIKKDNDEFEAKILKNGFFIFPLISGQLLRWLLPAFLMIFYVFMLALLMKKFLLIVDSLISIIIVGGLILLSVADSFKEKKAMEQKKLNNSLLIEWQRLGTKVVVPVVKIPLDALLSDFIFVENSFYYAIELDVDVSAEDLIALKRKIENRLVGYYRILKKDIRKGRFVEVTNNSILIKARQQ